MHQKAMSKMNLSLFITQINQVLQNAPLSSCLEEVCELLRMHTGLGVSICDKNGILIELLKKEGTTGTSQLVLPIFNDWTMTMLGDVNSEENTLAINIAISICTILLRQMEGQHIYEQNRKRESVRNLINTLTFSELEAAVHICGDISATGKVEGLLVAGHIADKLGFTRSIVTGALKKLEGASLIETRSLGMKGTFIKVKELVLLEELKKL